MSAPNQISTNSPQQIAPPQYKKAGWNMLISAVAIAALLLLTAAAVSLVVFSGFMFSIGVVPDGLILLTMAVAAGALAFYVGYKAYQRVMITHNSLHHPEKLAPKPA